MNMGRIKAMGVGAMILILFCFLLGGCSKQEKPPLRTVEQLSSGDYTIGVSDGGAAGAEAMTQVFPTLKPKHYKSDITAYMAVQQGKLDAYVYDRSTMEFAIANGLKGVRLLDEEIGDAVPIAIAISPITKIPGLLEKTNAFLEEVKSDGTLDDMYRRWVSEAQSVMPNGPIPENPTWTLRVGTTGTLQPFTYYEGDRLTGYDIELVHRLAAYLNAEVEIKIFDFGGIAAAAESGKIDCIVANFNATEERRKQIPFSEPIDESKTAIMVRDDATGGAAELVLAPLETAEFGVMTGTTAESYIKKTYPQAKISTYSSITDAFLALSSDKVDYVLTAYTTALNAMRSLPIAISKMDVVLEESAIAVAKGNDDLLNDINGVLDRFRADGTMEKVLANWTTQGQDYVLAALPVSDGANGVIRVAISADREPICFVQDGQFRGLDCELIERIAYELGKTVEYTNMPFSSLIAALASGKADVIISNMTPTEERKKSVNFTKAYFDNPQVLTARTLSEGEDESFWSKWKDSFTSTFLTENRWKLIANGLMVTVLTSILSGIFGSLLGFGVCMLRRSRNRPTRSLTAALIRVVQGTPIVVLLMILYYVIFGSFDISAILVSVLGFSINFAVYVAEMMRSGIDAVDSGQLEAATALGYSKMQTFWKVTFPQAARYFLPVFKGEFISMVKMTSVVGYIAVQDLTNVSDIIRSRTMEAFFPLVATAVLYFLIANLLTMILSLIEIRLDPKRRPRLVKGVSEE